MSLRLQITDKSLPTDLLPNRFEAIWPRLTSLRSLTLVFTSASSCPAWLAGQLQSISTLQTLRLCIFGNSLGPHLRAPSQLQNLHIEIHPPDLDGRISHWAAPNEPVEVSREAYHDWTDLFNDVSDLINENCSGYDLKRITWFIHWTMVHSFYKHMKQRSSEPSMTKYINASFLNSLSHLSLTLESQMGTRPFLDAVGGLPLTDLAFTAYDLSLLNGTVFRVFCSTFPELRRLRVSLRAPSITVEDGIGSMAEGFANEDEFIKGLISLRHLRAYKGPILFQRQNSVEAHHPLRSQLTVSLARLLRLLRETGMISPRTLFQWHVWSDGVYGPKQYMILPEGGPKELK
ncbi:hypothetical protein FRC12_002485 [Ceratobasidium sp. 428]|nr:hypothetical protein FRC12_002485 [Ceratobasidium sp. 428]